MVEIKPGIYHHYKGGEYEIIAQGKNTEDGEEEVTYRSLADGKIWIRPLAAWQEEVDSQDGKRPRFSWLRNSEIDDYEDRYKRALADYQNIIKQSAKEKDEFAKFALGDFLQDLLPVYDHLKMSVASLPEEEKNSAWVKGVEYVLKQFKDVLSAKGVEEIKTLGEKFDHNLMEAVDGNGDIVTKEITAGYLLNGRVLRAARVIVS